MKAQRDWSSPVEDSTDDTSIADIVDSADLPSDGDFSQAPFDNGLNDDVRASAVNHRHRWVSVLVIIAMIAIAAGGFAWHRSRQGGSALNCSSQNSAIDAKDYCFGGFEPLQPSGERLTLTNAGPYFTKAVNSTYAANDAVRLAAVRGDKDAVNKAAAIARDRAQQAAETLAARIWPKSLDKPIRMVIIEYQERASIYKNLSTNRNADAIDWMAFSQFQPSAAQQLIRNTLELPSEPAPALPINITGFDDTGTCTGYNFDTGQAVEATHRCFTVTAVNRTKAEVSYISLDFKVLGSDGTIRDIGANASSGVQFDKNDNIIEHGGIRKGSTVTLNMTIDPSLLRKGDRFMLSTWSVEDIHGDHHQDAFTAAQAQSFSMINDYQIGEVQ